MTATSSADLAGETMSWVHTILLHSPGVHTVCIQARGATFAAEVPHRPIT